jgi:very-short-patch-repair endonuclease
MVPRPELSTYTGQNDRHTSKVRVAELAARQSGCLTWAQLRAVGVAEKTVRRWKAVGYLVPILPGVYSVGPVAEDERTRLLSLALFAGPGAALSHGTSAHWRGWLRYPVTETHISTPRRIRPQLAGVALHCERELVRELINGIPCTTTTQTLLDLAATEDPRLVNRSLAQLDFERKLDARAIREACGRGKPGSAKLLKALNNYMPQLAKTKSELEDEFLYLCQRAKLPLPQVNTSIHGIEVDCHWPELKLVVELDGHGNHGTASQRNRDQRRALKLRAHGLTILRYTRDQVFFDAKQITLDLQAEIRRLRATYPS